MPNALVISVRLLDDRYHGCLPDGNLEDWPPAPFRLIKALLAGALLGRWKAEWRDDTDGKALRWLEQQKPPCIIAPAAKRGQEVNYWVPNNDGDLVFAGVLKRNEARTGKTFKPWLVNSGIIHYVWPISDTSWSGSTEEAERITQLTQRIYQLGRGIDPACAVGRILRYDEIEKFDGIHFFPQETSNGRAAVPMEGVLTQLLNRYEAYQKRLDRVTILPPVSSVRFVEYRPSIPKPTIVLFALRDPEKDDHFASMPALSATIMAASVRDQLTTQLLDAIRRFPKHVTFEESDIQRFVTGRAAVEEDKNQRLRFLPLPSIGHDHADGEVRRLMVVLPDQCPIRAEVVARSLDYRIVQVTSGDKTHGRIRLVRMEESEHRMMKRFVPPEGARVWRSVTPVVLPGSLPTKGRSAQTRQAAARTDAKRRARAMELARIAFAHAGLNPNNITITRLQKESFRAREPRADAAWDLPVSSKTGQAWLTRPRVHLEIRFREPFQGPLALGDGRFLGLGLFTEADNLGSLNIGISGPSVEAMLMSITTASGDDSTLPSVACTLPQAELFHRATVSFLTQNRSAFSAALLGHDQNRVPLRGPHEHAHIQPLDLDKDGHLDHVLVWASMGLDATAQKAVRAVRQIYTKYCTTPLHVAFVGLGCLEEFRCLPGKSGTSLRSLLGPQGGATKWASHTPFVPPRHLKKSGKNTLPGQILAELASRGLPEPVSIQSIDRHADSNFPRLHHFIRSRQHGPKAPIDCGFQIQLTFAEPVRGPLCLGYASHFGLGMFAAID